LAFKQGDKIRVKGEFGEWWFGQLIETGEEGHFPANYVGVEIQRELPAIVESGSSQSKSQKPESPQRSGGASKWGLAAQKVGSSPAGAPLSPDWMHKLKKPTSSNTLQGSLSPRGSPTAKSPNPSPTREKTSWNSALKTLAEQQPEDQKPAWMKKLAQKKATTDQANTTGTTTSTTTTTTGGSTNTNTDGTATRWGLVLKKVNPTRQNPTPK